jgi:hypothetical protein
MVSRLRMSGAISLLLYKVWTERTLTPYKTPPRVILKEGDYDI